MGYLGDPVSVGIIDFTWFSTPSSSSGIRLKGDDYKKDLATVCLELGGKLKSQS